MTSNYFNFTVKCNEEKECSVNCTIDVFSENKIELLNYASALGGIMLNSNTAKFSTDEAFIAFTTKLLNLTSPLKKSRFSKKR